MYTIEHIRQIIKGTWLQEKQPDARIAHLLLDSRQVLFAKSALFFALPGEHHNGHDYLKEAYQQGVRNFIVSKKIPLTLKEANIILVENSLSALQQLAAFHRQQFDLTCIGITGSNGKTIVKELLFQLLRHKYRIVRSPKSYNSQIGVPLSVWPIEAQHELGIFEAGISQMEEMEKLAPIIDCQIGVFTNIGSAHSEGFPSIKEKITEKIQLFKGSETIVYCKDNIWVDKAMQELPGKKFFTWSKEGSADLKITEINKGEGLTTIRATYKRNRIFLDIPFSDDAYIENVIHCWAVLLLLKIDEKNILDGMIALEAVAMRLELKEGINGCKIINDSYNSDLGSLQIALQFLEQQSQSGKCTLILSDILQSGRSVDTLYQEVARLIVEKKVDQLIGIGTDVPTIKPFLPKDLSASFFDTTSDFLESISTDQFQNQNILLKGARQFGFEQIANRLSQKVHRTVLEINMNALNNNLHVYSRYLEPGTRMMVMVKASAYGSGSAEVAKLLEFNKVDYLAVAYTDEGISLRKAGIQAPIMVLNPEEHSLEQMIHYDLEPEIYSFSLLNKVILLSTKKTCPIHLKLDTGMNRLGFNEKHLEKLTKLLQTHPKLKIQSIFSHLAASEDPQHDAFTRQQIKRFDQLHESITTTLSYRPMRHILNSGGIIRFPKHHMEMVRLGIGLYGVDAAQQIQDQLQVALTLKASISQVKEVIAGETIGYSRKGFAEKNMRIATISIGYADGLLRAAGNRRHQVGIHGQLAPIVGNVCMDMCMVDVSHISEAKEGDEVIVFGEHPTVFELAKHIETIVYEVFTNISDRVKRVYIQE